MPDPMKIKKAVLQQIAWNEEGQVTNEGPKFEVQFNPETLNVAFSNQVAGGDQAGGSAIQFNSKGTTKLTFDLVFDVTDPKIAERFNTDNKPSSIKDVRKITKLVADFMQTERSGSGKDAKFTPPGIRFSWGSFRFDGVVNSLTEKIEFFSAEGIPLRSTLSVSITKQDVDINFSAPDTDAQGNPNAGTAETTAPEEGKNSMADQTNKNGTPKPWQGDALANGIENPLDLPVGQPLSLGGELAASFNAGLQGGIGLGASAGFSAGIGGSLGGSFGGSIGGGIGLGIGISGGAALSGGLGGGLNAGVGLGIGLGVGFDGGLDTTLSTAAAINAGVGPANRFSPGALGVDIPSANNFQIDASAELALKRRHRQRSDSGCRDGF
ncbi:MAG: hypothetical protein NVV73_00975 [Cellvibrionaceae bacterium]|nr:hypothetical protein [Cellvibrionaceae bacterium]